MGKMNEMIGLTQWRLLMTSTSKILIGLRNKF